MAPSGLPDPELLASGRVHEATGPGRFAFAGALAGRLAGPVLWVQDRAAREVLYPPGLAAFFDPVRLILTRPKDALEVLQVTEEALRAGVARLVVTELAEAPDLTASRRLQLAAGTGGGRGLCLVPEDQLRSNAAETRWMCRAVPGSAGQDWEILKNRRGRRGRWSVRWSGGQFVESPACAEPA